MAVCDRLLAFSIVFSSFIPVVSELHSFLLLNSIPLCGYTVFVYSFMSWWAFRLFYLWLWWLMLLWTFVYTFLCGHVFISPGHRPSPSCCLILLCHLLQWTLIWMGGAWPPWEELICLPSLSTCTCSGLALQGLQECWGLGQLQPFHPGGQAAMPSSRRGVTPFGSTSPFIYIEGEQRSKHLVPRQKQTQHFND